MKWTKKEIQYLKENYGKIYNKEISKILNKPKSTIVSKAFRSGFHSNLCRNSKGNNNPMFNKKHSKKSKEKISRTKKLRWKKDKDLRKKTLKLLEKLHKNKIGKKLTEETKRKIGLGNKNKFVSEETKLKIKNRNYNWLKGNKNPMKKEENLKKCMQSNFIKPSLPEIQTYQIIKLNNLPFIYTGDGKKIIEGYCPDFLNKKHKKIIEVNGNFWHNLEKVKKRDRKKTKIYNKLGYKKLVIWEHQFKENPQKITEQIINFLHQN